MARVSTGARLKPLHTPPVRSEAAIQADILEMLRVGYPDVFVFSVPNGGMIMDPRVVAKLKWQGLKPGVPDLVLCWRDPGAYDYEVADVGFIEVKSIRGTLSPEQKSVHETLRSLGHRVAVCKSTDGLRKVLAEWGAPCRISG